MSTILVDNLTGKTSAGSITVTSEGGAATQSLQQGLAKAWAWVDQYLDNAIDNSLNAASFTDAGIGQGYVNLTNSMDSGAQVSQILSYRSGIPRTSGNSGASMNSSSAVITVTKNVSDSVTDTEFGMTLHGDLA